jgi:Zn-dependent protease
MDERTKRALWVVIGAVVLIALVAHHNITQQEIIIFCVIVPSIILHEVTHGWVANAFGDDTAKRAGRLSLNPLVHIDPIGTLLVPALLSLGGVGFFGWAKPVPVNVGRLRHPRNEGVVVSLAGPAMNAALAAIFGLLFVHFARGTVISTGNFSVGAQILFYASLVNVGLCAFNLIPIPPLDGSVLFERLLPRSWWPGYLRYRQYTMPILLGLVLLNFFLYPHGPITWFFNQLYSWWQSVLGF